MSSDLQHRIESLEWSRRRWRRLAVAGWAALALVLLGGTALGVSRNLAAVAAERRAAEAGRARADQALREARRPAGQAGNEAPRP